MKMMSLLRKDKHQVICWQALIVMWLPDKIKVEIEFFYNDKTPSIAVASCVTFTTSSGSFMVALHVTET